MTNNMIFLIIKGSVEEAEAAAVVRGFNLKQASKSPRWNETLAYVTPETEYDAERRIIQWMCEETITDGTYAPGTLLWYATGKEGKTFREAEQKGTRE